MKAYTGVVDAVPLRDKPILKVSFARVRVAERRQHGTDRRRKAEAKYALLHRHFPFSKLPTLNWKL